MSWLTRTALLAFVICFVWPAAAQAPTYFGLRFPDTVADFPRGETIDLEKDHPGRGYRVRYNAEPWVITVSIYDLGIKDIPDSLSADTVTAQFDKARAGIYAAEKKRNGSVEDKGRFDINGPDGRPRYICGAYLVVDTVGKDLRIDHTLCLTTWHGKFIQFRLGTFSKNGSLAVAKRFVAAWTAILWP